MMEPSPPAQSPMSPHKLSISTAQTLLSRVALEAAFSSLLSQARAAVLEPSDAIAGSASAAGAWALIALLHQVPEGVAAEGFAILSQTDRCPVAGTLRINLDHALGLMAEALRDPDQAYLDWVQRHTEWHEAIQSLERAA